MKTGEFLLKGLREVYTRAVGYPSDRSIDNSRVEYADEAANDYMYSAIRQALEEGRGFAACKLGTVELANIVAHRMEHRWQWKDYLSMIKGYPLPLYKEREMQRLHLNAGFFPTTESAVRDFVDLSVEDLKEVDVLASYAYCERYIADLLAGCTKVNLDGYYAPFRYPHPWSRILKDKRVLVIHPFRDSILQQYARRELIHPQSEALPPFKSLRVIKAVQSIAGNDCGYATWFDALDAMKREMEKEDFDIALIGCGAYGFPLTVHAKRLGKVGIHLAGWTQMLFGIYGRRWMNDQPEYARFINEHWIRPAENEKPQGAAKVEGGCYW